MDLTIFFMTQYLNIEFFLAAKRISILADKLRYQHIKVNMQILNFYLKLL